ncbi:MAG: alpha/beta hydrolase [Chloroflexota bacterium]|nr:alpha/beta hydrolase [Chloroflexota bacterium]
MQRVDGTMQAGELTLMPFIVKADLGKPGKEPYRIAAELGRLLVPERRSNPKSRLIELAFVRLQSHATHPLPPLVVLAGGPGASAIDALKREDFLPWIEALREVGDVILLDQRGTGLSNPRLDCLERWDLPLDQPGNRAAFLQRGQERARACAAFWQRQGVDLFGYTTEENADDVEALRQALGLEYISLCGISYGSHLALATIKRHETHIARAIVALVEGPDDTLKLPSAIQKQLEHLKRMVKEDPQFAGTLPDLLELMQTVLERLQEPVTVPITDTITGVQVAVCVGAFDLQFATARALGSLAFLRMLPACYVAMSQGDFSWLGRTMLEFRREWIGSAMSYMMDCASGCSEARRTRIQQEVPQTLLGDMGNFPFPEICDAWGRPDLGAAFRTPVTSNVPAFFLSGTLDARTPISNAEAVRAGFPHSQHLLVEGAAHSFTACISTPAIRDAMVSFLQGKAATITNVTIPFMFAPLKSVRGTVEDES